MCYVLCSYKEESEAATESDELIEMEASQSQDCSNNDAETIEAVLYSRVGKKGGKMMVLLMFWQQSNLQSAYIMHIFWQFYLRDLDFTHLP